MGVLRNSKMSSNTSFSLNITGNILNGIHPNTNELESKNKEGRNTKPGYFGIPEHILDGIHPKVHTSSQYDNNTTKNCLLLMYFVKCIYYNFCIRVPICILIKQIIYKYI